LRNAGYEVSFALSANEALQTSRANETRILVLDAELEDTSSVLDSFGERDAANLVLLCAPKHVGQLAERFSKATNVAVSDSYAPPENVLFIVNELMNGGASNKRASRRLLYGTQVIFRGEVRATMDVGFTYNISEGGMYVRTLAPPQEDVVWLELQAPRTDRRVQLEGQVVWRRPFGHNERATVPAGFGFRIEDATKRNLDAWVGGYHDFSTAMGLFQALPEAS
jgi:Tfp pilus assembly protein PilZ